MYVCMHVCIYICIYRAYVGECRVRLDDHVTGGQGARVGVPLLGLYLLRFDDHLRYAVILDHSLHRCVHLIVVNTIEKW
jgi:hypothetical protein